ncbi:2-dehydro-3-deoxygalactonokinase [Sphingomonas sp.]|uniref:2-dehydro-3-deoxygalactonokinase n=1 Tax=Sphingomonas sp. TaxID=28214 RepID=UPI00345651C2
MAADGAFIAIDWGTTNRRAYLIDANGAVCGTIASDRGVLALTSSDYPREIAALRAHFGVEPVLAAGMVGSNRGWHDVPYIDAPATLDDLAHGTVEVAPNVRIVPGIAVRGGGHADVMRGEEVQVLGAIAAGAAPADAAFCQPGTHNKWIATTDGHIVDSATAMTGELFALLRQHGTLAQMIAGEVTDGAAFRDGVARGAGATDLAAALFEIRAAVLLGRLAAADAGAYASGVLIGADVGARRDLAARPVHLLASGALASLYRVAIEACGGRVVALDATAAFVAGIHRIRELTA